ncbi:MAG: endo-1,4-beta-xylanase [Bacteroidota bacterium]|nr:endo-1,4-beta-xylanase [Bacteroidota bacterium]
MVRWLKQEVQKRKSSEGKTFSYSHFLIFSSSVPVINILFFMVIFCPLHIFSQPLAAGKTKFVGSAISDGFNIPSTFSKYWNQVTPGNAGKWGSIEFTPGSYSWSQLDAMYNYALSHGYPFKEHNLIWNSQQPGFMTDGSLDSAQEYREIVNWIDTCAQRYPETAFCDVVNEPIDHAPSYKNVLGGDGTTGWDWVIKAFELARQYWQPKTKLLLNDYNVINDATRNAKYLQIINLLKDRGLIDGIGVQAHSFEVDGPSVTTLKANLDKLTATGLPVYISEFSVNESDDNTQLLKYQSIFPALYEDPGVRGITLWGYIEYDMWSREANAYLVTDRRAERPAIQWLRTYLEAPFRPALISPTDTGESLAPLFSWNSSDSATAYHLQVSAVRTFSSLLIDTTVADTVFQSDTLNANTTYYWHVSALNAKAESPFSSFAYFTTGEAPTGVEEHRGTLLKFTLEQNYPNPFNPATHFRFTIADVRFVTLKVYDILGREVATLVNERKVPGVYEVNFDASNLSSGMYFYSLRAGNDSAVREMLLLR